MWPASVTISAAPRGGLDPQCRFQTSEGSNVISKALKRRRLRAAPHRRPDRLLRKGAAPARAGRPPRSHRTDVADAPSSSSSSSSSTCAAGSPTLAIAHTTRVCLLKTAQRVAARPNQRPRRSRTVEAHTLFLHIGPNETGKAGKREARSRAASDARRVGQSPQIPRARTRPADPVATAPTHTQGERDGMDGGGRGGEREHADDDATERAAHPQLGAPPAPAPHRTDSAPWSQFPG